MLFNSDFNNFDYTSDFIVLFSNADVHKFKSKAKKNYFKQAFLGTTDSSSAFPNRHSYREE